MSLSLSECAKSSNCHKRMLFLEICQFILDIFSRNFFKSNFFDPVLQMASVSWSCCHGETHAQN